MPLTMARFRDTAPELPPPSTRTPRTARLVDDPPWSDTQATSEEAPGSAAARAPDTDPGDAAADPGAVRPLGRILGERLGLSVTERDQIARHASERRLRYGDAAVHLGLASAEEVLAALAEQYGYPMAPRGETGYGRELVMLAQPFSRQAEALRAIRNRLTRDAGRGDRTLSAIAVVSPGRSDGKTFVAANLGVALAQRGGRTVIVDADLRGPRLHEIFQLEPGVGLAGVLGGRTDLQALRPVAGVPGLAVLPAGQVPPNPLELIERPAFAQLLGALQARFDHVVVDTAAAAWGADPFAVADRCHGTLLVARRDRVTLAALQTLVATLGEGPSRLAGMVMNEF
jgi:chain length determinant protein tyrosine kinase EpsG